MHAPMNRCPGRRAFALALIFAGFFATQSSADPIVTILSGGNAATISWPTGAVTYALEYADSLPATNWLVCPNPPFPSGKLNFVTNTSATPHFFRLHAPGPSTPVLRGPSADTSVPLGGSGLFAFNFWDPDGDIAWIEAVE